MRTTNKLVIEKLKQHVMETFDQMANDENNYRELEQPELTGTQSLIDQIDYMRYANRSTYQTSLDYVEGGSFLIYHTDVKEFLNSLGINETGKEYSDDKSWKLYCHLVAREMTKIYEGAK